MRYRKACVKLVKKMETLDKFAKAKVFFNFVKMKLHIKTNSVSRFDEKPIFITTLGHSPKSKYKHKIENISQDKT